MSGFTYSGLKTAVQDYCLATETTFVNSLPTFIQEAEERILKNVEMPLFRKNQIGSFTTSNAYLATPTDFLSPYSLAISSSGNYSYLLLKNVSFIRDYTPNESTTGLPKYYAMFDDDTFLVAPTPDSNYNVELHYKYRPLSLTAGAESGTTWLSENAPDAMLYGTLVEAATFLKTPDEIMLYQQRFDRAMQALANMGEGYGMRDEFRPEFRPAVASQTLKAPNLIGVAPGVRQ
tara:strand:- start:57 stop:755 length:699 start_codon:yes stop_codon:yes gene_type:complete